MSDTHFPERPTVETAIKPLAPNRQELERLIAKYAPLVYLHPEEKYNIASVETYLEQAELENRTTHSKQQARAEYLPVGNGNKDSFHLELKNSPPAFDDYPVHQAKTYVHAKAHSDVFTDLQFWFFFAWNGPADASIKWLIDNITGHSASPSLEPLGVQEGSWKRLTLRFDNESRLLTQVFFSQPGGGTWLDADKIQRSGDQIAAYISKNTHGFYPGPGIHVSNTLRLNVHSSALEVSLTNETAKGEVIDFSKRFELVCADYLTEKKPLEPPWLNFSHPWGKENTSALNQKSLKEIIKRVFGTKLEFLLSNSIQMELLSYLQTFFTREVQNGSSGPKYQECWSGEETD